MREEGIPDKETGNPASTNATLCSTLVGQREPSLIKNLHVNEGRDISVICSPHDVPLLINCLISTDFGVLNKTRTLIRSVSDVLIAVVNLGTRPA